MLSVLPARQLYPAREILCTPEDLPLSAITGLRKVPKQAIKDPA